MYERSDHKKVISCFSFLFNTGNKPACSERTQAVNCLRKSRGKIMIISESYLTTFVCKSFGFDEATLGA